MKTKKYTKINSKSFFDFKDAASNLRITKISQTDIIKMKRLLDQLINNN